MGGYNGNILASVDVIPHPSSSSCTIPNLPQPRRYHSISLLSGGRVVVCGGRIGSTNYNSNSCISWGSGNDSWVPLYTMRYHNCPGIAESIFVLNKEQGQKISYSMDATISS